MMKLVDMISGTNLDPKASSKLLQIRKRANSIRTRLGTYINQLKTMPPNSDARVRWEIFQRDLKPGRERIKYENLLIKSNYITTAEAEREYHIQTDVAEIKYLFVPFYAVSDSAVSVTDDDLKAYYNKNIERYKTEESRDIKYISVPVEASSDDSALQCMTNLPGMLPNFGLHRTIRLLLRRIRKGKIHIQNIRRATLPLFVSPR